MSITNLIKQNREKIYTIVLLALPLVLLISAFIFSKVPDEIIEEISEPIAPEILNPFDDIETVAKAVIVKDLNTGEIIYAKNSGKVLPLASITKVLTALTVKEISTSKIASITLRDLALDGNNFLFPGEVFDQDDLINFTLVGSSNDGSSALASSASTIPYNKDSFIAEMNSLAQKIGMLNSIFHNESGLDLQDNVISGADGTARDIAELFEYVLVNNPELLESTTKSSVTVYSFNGISHKIDNTNQEVGNLPNALASKTGFTDLAGGNLAVVIDPGLNRPIVIVVLGSTKDARFEDVELLSEKVSQYFSYKRQGDF